MLLMQPAVSPSADEAASGNLSDIVLSHSVRVAFYEAAPRSVEASMRRAVKEVCAASKQSAPDWLCGGMKLFFLRGVDVRGNKHKTGFVCSFEGDRSTTIKYWLDDMIWTNEDCRFIWFEGDKNRHGVDLNFSLDEDSDDDSSQQ